MARETNAIVTFDDLRYMSDNEGFIANQTIPTGNECVTKSELIQNLYVYENYISSYIDNELILPLTEYREQNDDIAPPDFIICRRIRRMGKLISIAPSVTPQHLNEVGEPIGLTPNYLQSVKDSSEYPKILVLTYNSFLNYSKLSQDYDEVLVINHKEINNDVSFLEKYDNIKVINRSIIDTCVKYDYYKNYSELKGESMKYAILEEIHKYISNKTAYIIYLYNERNNTIRRIPFLDSRNLKKFLNTKP